VTATPTLDAATLLDGEVVRRHSDPLTAVLVRVLVAAMAEAAWRELSADEVRS